MRGYDVLVVGGGPGGLATAIFCAERGLSVALFDGGALGGLLVTLFPEKMVTNYLGFPEGIKAEELAARLISQAEEYDVEILRERVLEITTEKVVKTEDGEYTGRAVVLATGMRPRELGVPGEEQFVGRGVSYYIKDPGKFKSKKVLVVGGGDAAVECALQLADIATVTLVHRRDKFRTHKKNVEALKKSNVEVLLNTELKEIKGFEKMEGVLLLNNNGEEKEMKVDEVVLATGLVPNTDIFAKLGLNVDADDRIVVDPQQHTNIEGLFAVGDITSGSGSLELIEVAIAQGAIAAHHIYLELAEPY
ncbi:MAG: NAD(P)/FAD-dependent oxidoreductase [Candidatus Hydrothermarchaeales archaeon]